MVFTELDTRVKELFKHHSELPVFLFENSEFTGDEYPRGENVITWDVWLDVSAVHLNQIGSIYVPGHASLKLWTDKDGHYEIIGPALIKHTGSDIRGYWRDHNHNHKCPPGSVHCGKRINWNLKSDISHRIAKIQFVRNMSWLQYMHDRMHQGHHIVIDGVTYYANYDELYKEICEGGHAGDFHCGCHNGLKDLKERYPDHWDKIHMNNFDDYNCVSTDHYIPSTARVGRSTHLECRSSLHHMIKSGNFLYRSDQPYYACGGKTYVNAHENGYVNRRHANPRLIAHDRSYIRLIVAGVIVLLIWVAIILHYYRFKRGGISVIPKKRKTRSKKKRSNVRTFGRSFKSMV